MLPDKKYSRLPLTTTYTGTDWHCPVMDLSAEVSAALRLLGDAGTTEQAKYLAVLQKVTEDLSKDTQAGSSTLQPGGEDDGKH